MSILTGWSVERTMGKVHVTILHHDGCLIDLLNESNLHEHSKDGCACKVLEIRTQKELLRLVRQLLAAGSTME